MVGPYRDRNPPEPVLEKPPVFSTGYKGIRVAYNLGFLLAKASPKALLNVRPPARAGKKPNQKCPLPW